MDRKEAKAKGKPFYIGQPCHACWCRKRYVSDGSCKDCRANRAYNRRHLDPADLAALRTTEAARKAAQRAKLQSVTPWQSIITGSIN